jgi:para-aminobenzoate synthetase/4-amino-4-deoxychorismate lyase
MKFTDDHIKNNDFSLLENSLSPGRSSHLFFQAHSECIVYTSDDFIRLFKLIQSAQKQNLFAVGYFTYDCARFLELSRGNIEFKSRKKPYAHFVFYEQHYLLDKNDTEQMINRISLTQESQSLDDIISDLLFDTSYDQYQRGFSKIQHNLLCGETYQVNYTAQYHFKFQGNYFKLYQRLRNLQRVMYSAFLPFSTGHVLSFSPELFFTKKSNAMHVRPMKGTVSRTGDLEHDKDQINFLRHDPKNKAENLIIVDLLRNDLATISEVGSVNPVSLFDIETYKTVYQMTSTIHSTIREDLSIKAILQSMFPCGSITGAPKISTMNIIAQVEQNNRELYTGAIGYIAPNNDMSFSVAIRTLDFDRDNNGRLGVGGGITTRSNVLDEWHEMHLKAKFFLDLPKNFQLIETLLYDGEYAFLKQHFKRLSVSSKILGFKFNLEQLKIELEIYEKIFHLGHYKVRILLGYDGKLLISYDEIEAEKKVVKPFICALADYKINQFNILYQYKTTSIETRGVYNHYYTQGIDQNCDDVLFQNRLGYLTESTRYNVVYQQNGKLYTPPIRDGLIPGIYREYLIESGKVVEKSLLIEELYKIEKLFLCNSVRGMVIAEYKGLVL